MSEVLRELVVALSLDSDNFSRNMRTINHQIKEAESTFRLAGAGIDKFEKSVKGTEAKLSMLGNKLTQQNRAVEQYSRALVAANQKLMDSYARQEKMKASLADARTEYTRLKTEVDNAAKEYRKLASSLGENDSATIAAKANLERYKQEFQDAHDKVKLLEGQITSNTKTLQNNADAVSKATTDLNNAKAAVRETEAEIKKLTEALYRMESKWTKAGESLTAFSKKADAIGKAMTKTGKAMTAAITTPIVALGATAVKASIDYESAFTSVRKTVEATEEEFDSLSDSVKEMSTEVATSGADIAEVMAVAGQLGIANKYLVSFTRTMIDLGNSTDIVADQATSTLAKFANITNMDQSQFSNLGSALVDLGNNYAATESAIMDMAMRLAAAGHQVGLSESQILGFATALSSVGIEAEMGGSAFSKALVKMEVASATGGKALDDFGKVAGMTAQEFKKLWDNDPAAAFQAFIVGLSRMDDEGESAIATLEEIGIKEVRLRDTLLRATNATDLFSKTQNTANKAWAENTALAVEANKRYATTKSRLINLKNTAMLFAQQIGDDLNPTIQELIDKGNELLQSFLGMDESQRMAIIKFAAFAAAAGPAILVLGKTVSAVSKVTSVLGKVSTGIGKFSANVKLAGGGFTGFTKTLFSSKLAVAALAAALIYGAIKLYDYASGAKAVREALEGMSKTADEWKSNAADTFYGSGTGLSFFGMSEDDFVHTARDAEGWLSGLLSVWSDGKNETAEIASEWIDGFKALTGSTREQLQALNQTAKEAGYTSVSSQLEADIAKLDQMDAEIARLLKKRKNKNFTEKDKVRLQELIDAREAIEVKYKLSPLEADGFETIRQKLEAEIARAQARGKVDADASVYENAMVAAAQGMAAVNIELDAQYDKEFALIGLMEDGAEKQQALSDLNDKYNQNRKAAAEEYAQTLQSMVMPVWNQADIQQAGTDIDTLTDKLRAYSIAAANDDTKGMAKVLEEMNALTADMDEAALVEYLGVLTQIQSLMDSGMTEAEVQALFPEIDVSGQMEQVAALAKFVEDHKGTLTGLSGIFSGAVPEEMLKIATDLDMTGAQARWDEFAANPGVITTQAVVDGYTEAEGILRLEPKVTAFISEYTEVPEGASKAALTPTGLLAYVSTYAEVVTGADVSGLTPGHVTAMVSAYQELATGADTSTLTPSEITAYISKYLEKSKVNTDGLTPEGITAFVLAYEEATGGASTASLTPTNVAAMVTRYLGAKDIDISKLSEPQIDAIVTAYADATNVDKTALKAELEATITAYKDKEGVTKPSYIESRIGIVGYDLTAYNEFVANNPVTLTGIVRVSDLYKNPSEVLNDPNATFWEGGKEVPVNLVPASKIDANTLIAYDADGTLHVLITPQIEGTAESVERAAAGVSTKYVTSEFFGKQSHNDWGWLNGLMGADLLTWMNSFNVELEAFERNKGSWVSLWGLLDDATISGIDKRMSQQFSGDNIANFSTYVAELVAAIQNGEEVSEEDIQNLQNIVAFLNNLELTSTGENIRAGVAQGMTEAGWDADAETVASQLEAALNQALGIESPSTRVKPVGEYVAAGVGAGMTEYDLSADAATVAANLEAALTAIITNNTLSTLGTSAAEGLASAMSSYSMAGMGTTVAANVKSAVAGSLTISTLHTIGLNAMAGLKAGINAGQVGVVAAMRAAARAAVLAAKSELKIASPSGVFRDEVGRMAMKGFGLGALLESKAQAKVIRNATRFLTGEAKEGAIAYSSNDNRRTYTSQNTISFAGSNFYINDKQDAFALAVEIASLTRRQQRGRGLRMA
ncbi:MAG: phage tail tape measure protein [Christensenellaceae bacterium]|nr:phage tail tape measure protein [Christensenellaceae bacterium]